MSRKITLEQVRRELRARACQKCPLRTPGHPGDPLDTDRPLDCEAACDLFIHLPKLERVARQLDPMLRSYDVVLRNKINQVLETIARSREGRDETSSALSRHRECVIRSLSELADQ